MLVLSRHQDQTIIFPNLGIRVEVLRVKGKNVSLGVEAPRAIRVSRGELTREDEIQCSTEIIRQLEEQLDQSVTPQQRHDLKNKLNNVSLALHAAQRKLEQNVASNGGSDISKDVNRYLAQAIDSLNELNVLAQAMPASKKPQSLEATASPPFASSSIAPESSGSDGGGRRLMIVEDNDNERELLAGVLENAGYQVIAVPDGQSALDYMESNGSPDIVLMDMNMPRLNGQQTISKIRSDELHGDLPIFGVSGLTQSEADMQLGESAVTGWFSKPVNPNQLVKYLHQQLDALAN